MADICVAHLVRKQNGPAPLRAFVESYRARTAGVGHELLIIFKGFGAGEDLGEYESPLRDVPHQPFFLPDEGFDLTPYFRVAENFDRRYFCFLNSFSVILDDGWLAKLHAHASRDGIGAAGATGSWYSHHSAVRREQGRPSAYAEILSDLNLPSRHPPAFALSDELKEKIQTMPAPRRLAANLYYYGVVAPYQLTTKPVQYYLEDRRRWRALPPDDYDPFPNPHLRTNAFMMRRETMLGLRRWEMREKSDAHRFESGKDGMTKQLLRAGLKVLVVGRDGRAYEHEEWPRSGTFAQGEQTNLLVSDNLTRTYDVADALTRALMSRGSWGREAAS
jgi:hypothetical protein